jgi:hypothetical protein
MRDRSGWKEGFISMMATYVFLAVCKLCVCRCFLLESSLRMAAAKVYGSGSALDVDRYVCRKSASTISVMDNRLFISIVQ